MTVDNYIQFFTDHNTVCLKSSGDNIYQIVKENDNPIAYFSHNEIVFKISNGYNTFAIKCFDDSINEPFDPIYDQQTLSDYQTSDLTLHHDDLKIDYQTDGFAWKKILFAKWLDNGTFGNCTNYYVKQLHQIDSNKGYKKRRTRVKSAVFAALFTLMASFSGIKMMYPDELFINPIDYKQLIADDSLRTLNIAKDKNKVKTIQPEIQIIKKQIAMPTLTELATNNAPIAKPETENKPIVEKTKKPKTIVADINKDEVTPKKKKEEAIKVINSKSAVTFRSTEF